MGKGDFAMTTAIQPALLSAEEFARLPEDGVPRELVRGRIVEGPMPNRRHGYICLNIGWILMTFVKENDLGRVMSNDSFVVTQHDPDTLRGADICFISFKRLPRGPLTDELYVEAPELVFEVRSPSDRWSKLVHKAEEYIEAGVLCVCVVDPKHENLTIFRPAEQDPTVLTIDDQLTLPDILPGFSIPVRKLFE
jgi:Uma2 family endonuclease